VFQSNPIGMAVQVIVTIYQNLLTNTFGLVNAVSAQNQGQKIRRELLKNPMAIALVTLGAQSAYLQFKRPSSALIFSSLADLSLSHRKN
jgi:hypothetical protein